MRVLDKVLFYSDRKIEQGTYIWNFVANILYSLQSAILLLIVTRYGNLDEAGIFSIIYATTHMLSTIGNYNMRMYQVSDAKNEYSFSTYWTSRLISCFLMIVVGIVYGLCSYSELRYIGITLCFVLYRVTDGIEDVVHGHIQKLGRLDVGSIAKSLRIIISSISFSLVYIITKNLLYASIIMFISSSMVLILCDNSILRVFKNINYRCELSGVAKLLWECFPICISALLQNYIVNIPKYAIDSELSPEMQAVFNILFMPIFAINMLSIFIFNPLVADMGIWWISNKLKKLFNCLKKQIIIIIFLTLVIAVCGYCMGCEVLGIVYGINLVEYKYLLSVLLLFGGMAALATFMGVVITIMRQQHFIIISYLVATGIGILFANKIVAKYGINGAGYLYGLLMFIVSAILLVVIIKEGIKAKSKVKDGKDTMEENNR